MKDESILKVNDFTCFNEQFEISNFVPFNDSVDHTAKYNGPNMRYVNVDMFTLPIDFETAYHDVFPVHTLMNTSLFAIPKEAENRGCLDVLDCSEFNQDIMKASVSDCFQVGGSIKCLDLDFYHGCAIPLKIADRQACNINDARFALDFHIAEHLTGECAFSIRRHVKPSENSMLKRIDIISPLLFMSVFPFWVFFGLWIFRQLHLTYLDGYYCEPQCTLQPNTRYTLKVVCTGLPQSNAVGMLSVKGTPIPIGEERDHLLLDQVIDVDSHTIMNRSLICNFHKSDTNGVVLITKKFRFKTSRNLMYENCKVLCDFGESYQATASPVLSVDVVMRSQIPWGIKTRGNVVFALVVLVKHLYRGFVRVYEPTILKLNTMFQTSIAFGTLVFGFFYYLVYFNAFTIDDDFFWRNCNFQYEEPKTFPLIIYDFFQGCLLVSLLLLPIVLYKKRKIEQKNILTQKGKSETKTMINRFLKDVLPKDIERLSMRISSVSDVDIKRKSKKFVRLEMVDTN
eukprot:TRINITY_DN209_c0_g1_i1.p1 TRINITY_DN209_c0_g1~~TRINITY_DN209_c0_g1_i1.p1  ORF type:complete len:512 (-),score=107.16 TRINITY_DN209_c0_g1_i1:51-1586(-)